MEEFEHPKQENLELSSKEKYARSIREFLVNHPNTAFEERNSLTSVVEPEVDLYASRYFKQYEDSYVSRLIDESTSIEERHFTDKERSGFLAEAPFYIYESEKVTSNFARLTVYKRASVVVIESKENELQVYVGGEKETGVYKPAERIYEHRYVQQITESENPLEALKKLEEDEKIRNSMMAYSREMMSTFAKSYNELFAEELAFTDKIVGVRASIERFSPSTLVKEILPTIPHELRSMVFPLKDLTTEEALRELVARGTQMDSHRYDLHRTIEYFGYKFGGGMNKKEIDKAIIIDRCPDKIVSKGGRYIGVTKNPNGVYYLFGTEADYDYEGRGKDMNDRQLIERICEEINSRFNQPIASLDDKQGGTTHTYWRTVGIAIDNSPKDEESMNQINEIVQKYIDQADAGSK